jgi:hypothetical protein
MTTVEYKDPSLIKKAKSILGSGESLLVYFHSNDARILSKSIATLQEIEARSRDKKRVAVTPAWKFIYNHLYLSVRFRRFMVVFWLAIANEMSMKVLRMDPEQPLEIVFEKSG